MCEGPVRDAVLRLADSMADEVTLQEEEALLRRMHAGERQSFRDFYDIFASRLYRGVIFPRVGVADLAEDVLRDTFLTAFEKIDSLRWQGRSLFHWLSRIAVNKIIDFHRRNKRTERFVQGYGVHVELCSRPGGPEEEVLAAERTVQVGETVQSLMAGLNPRYRRAVELRFLQGMSREACADAMAISVGNFDVVLFRAVQRLRDLLAARGGLDGS